MNKITVVVILIKTVIEKKQVSQGIVDSNIPLKGPEGVRLPYKFNKKMEEYKAIIWFYLLF